MNLMARIANPRQRCYMGLQIRANGAIWHGLQIRANGIRANGILADSGFAAFSVSAVPIVIGM
jgi:hypothetical protein